MFKKSLCEIRKEKKLTQESIAVKLGISVASYNMYENSARKIPSNIAEKIAKILDVKLNDIFLPATFTVGKTKHGNE